MTDISRFSRLAGGLSRVLKAWGIDRQTADNVTVVDDQMRPPSTRMGVKNTKNNGVEFVVTLGVDGIL